MTAAKKNVHPEFGAQSMTGFGRGETDQNGIGIVVELRSVNHRYLDLRSHIDLELTHFEAEAHAQLKKLIRRGRVDVSIRLKPDSISLTKLVLNEDMARQYQLAWQQLAQAMHVDAKPDLKFIAAQAGVWQHQPQTDLQQALASALNLALQQASRNLLDARRQEGRQLCTDIYQRLQVLQSLGQDAQARVPIVNKAFAQRLKDRVDDFLAAHKVQETNDPARLFAEVALLAERADASEELQRMNSHIENSQALLFKSEAVGRKLDFLCQEMLREINTLGSKANDLETTQLVVELKAELERVREQVQNLE